MTDRADVAILGAGPAGLCAAWHAERRGWRTLLIDRADRIGGSWVQADPRMRCLSARERDRMPDGSMPMGPGPFASAAEVVAWLERFGARLAQPPLLATAVSAVTREGDGFLLQSSTGRIATQRVIVATGEHGRPRWPEVPIAPGAGCVHAASLPQHQIAPGERVIVIGAGNSAAQVARAALERGAVVTLSVRRPPLRSLVYWSTGPLVRPVVRWAAKLQWWLSGLPVDRVPANAGCLRAVPLQDPWLIDAVHRGQVQLVGETVAIERGGVRLRGDATLAADRVIAATGYMRETGCVADLATCDRDGFPRHRRGLSSEVPGLAFVGLPCMRTRRSGFLRGFADDAAAVVGAMA